MRITEGDKVRCRVIDDMFINGIVQHIPNATGDSWHIKADDDILYVLGQFIFIAKFPEPKTGETT